MCINCQMSHPHLGIGRRHASSKCFYFQWIACYKVNIMGLAFKIIAPHPPPPLPPFKDLSTGKRNIPVITHCFKTDFEVWASVLVYPSYSLSYSCFESFFFCQSTFKIEDSSHIDPYHGTRRRGVDGTPLQNGFIFNG